tara:strand:- start:27 stop:1148 length:1122 start_codon:yes stop_codon:yes gene_type:complete
MATTFKTFSNSDKTSTRTMLHEAIPLTGTIVSGTYNEENIKNYSHGMFTSIYDYPYLSSSANHILDITYGISSASAFVDPTTVQQEKKQNIYNQMAQVLVGYDANGDIRRFDEDGNFGDGGAKIDEAWFFNFSRLLTKDEIKKGSFEMTFLTGGAFDAAKTDTLTIGDTFSSASGSAGGVNDFRVNSPAGEYGILYTKASSSNGAYSNGDLGLPAGLIYYQAGIAVLTASVFGNLHVPSNAAAENWINVGYTGPEVAGSGSSQCLMTGSEISGGVEGVRNRIHNISFSNTTELNSTIHFCRANHNEFNYSANPTYLSSSQIVVKDKAADSPVAYVTTIGLYAPDNELLAVAKLSEPIRKDPTTELTFRVRLDY